MKIPFEHRQAAHCESGVTSNILHFYGIDISEPMVFGIGGGLFFSYMPFITLGGAPVISFRPLPGQIFSRVMRRLRIKVRRRLFLNRERSMQELDKLLAHGIPVGTVVGMFYLPYVPKEYRFHFNAHNLCVIGKEGSSYTVSDPVSMTLNMLTYEELRRVRFAKGTWPPQGKMYWVNRRPKGTPDLKAAIISGIRLNCSRMLDIPIPYFGVKGIHRLARAMRSWEKKLGDRRAALNLVQVVRMLEEIGTGGAGFRYMYAAFLHEAAELTGIAQLAELSPRMTAIGDLWRDFAFEAARKFKNRDGNLCSYEQLADKLDAIGDEELAFFISLKGVV